MALPLFELVELGYLTPGYHPYRHPGVNLQSFAFFFTITHNFNHY